VFKSSTFLTVSPRRARPVGVRCSLDSGREQGNSASTLGAKGRPEQVQQNSPRKAVRGRDASYLAPPAQNRTGGFPAYGSCLGCVTARVAVYVPAPLTREPGSDSGIHAASGIRHVANFSKATPS